MAAATSGAQGGAKAAGGTALVVRKKEKLTRSTGGRPKKQRAASEVGPEQRRLLVAKLLMERKNYRQIMEELLALPEEERPKSVSLGTVARDVAALRAEWMKERTRLVDELVGEEVERLNRLEAVWWPDALEKDKDATDKVLAIQRQRMALLGLGAKRGAVQVTAGAVATGAAGAAGGVNTEGPLPAGAQVKVLVEYVDDRRDL